MQFFPPYQRHQGYKIQTFIELGTNLHLSLLRAYSYLTDCTILLHMYKSESENPLV